jgi:predicted TIM-barrel fold metal-dependent hydrolase
MTDVPVIDYWCNLFTEEGMLEVRGSSAGTTEDLFNMPNYLKERIMTPEEFLGFMDEHGIDTVLIPSPKVGDWESGGLDIDITYEQVHEVVSQYPDRMKGLASINPYDRMKGVREMERAIEEYGFVGAQFHPYGFELPVNHRRCYPFYAKCVELDIPIVMQIGHSAERMPNRMGKPIHLDDIALDFPELDIVASHTGWPWSKELEALAWKHPNVHVGMAAHAPQYWEDNLVEFMRTRGKDKVLFGSDYPLLRYDRMFGEIENYEFSDGVQRKFFRENAQRVFDL